MFKLEEINEKGEAIKSKEFKTLKECADKTGVAYKKIQNLYYYNSGKIKYSGRQKSQETDQLISKYRLTKVEANVNIVFDD